MGGSLIKEDTMRTFLKAVVAAAVTVVAVAAMPVQAKLIFSRAADGVRHDGHETSKTLKHAGHEVHHTL